MRQTRKQLGKFLSKRPWLLADGATGTELFNMGLSAGESPELWNATNSKKIVNLYNNSINAGVDLFLTNSFGSNISRLKLHNADKRSHELSRISAEIGRECVDKILRTVLVAGSMGPTGELLKPFGRLSYEDAVEIFHIQADGLKIGGVDLLWIETMSDANEFSAAVEAITSVDMPWCGTMSFDTSERTMMGFQPKDMISMISKFENCPLAFGANCGVGPSDLLRTIKSFRTSSIPLIAKGNAGIPKFKDGRIYYDGTPELMAKYACLARDLGVKIIGGCCGTTQNHLLTMRAALESHSVKKPPSLDAIKLSLGNFSSLPNQKYSNKRLSRRRRISL